MNDNGVIGNLTIKVNYDDGNEASNSYQNIENTIDNCDVYLNTDYITDDLRTYYGSLDDDTEDSLDEVTGEINCLKALLEETYDTYRFTDNKLYKFLLLLIDNFVEVAENEKMINEEISDVKEDIIKKLGYADDSEEANKLRKDIDAFVRNYKENDSWGWEDNKKILEFFLSKIPDNYKEYNDNCKWDSEPSLIEEYEGCDASCQWFDVNGTNIRLTSYVDNTVPYPGLQKEFNRVFSYNAINMMKNWDPRFLKILNKRDYIDVLVPDATIPSGAAHYNLSFPYTDRIVVPTRMGDQMAYSNSGTYDWLFNAFIHESVHYLDAIVGLTQIKEYKTDEVSDENKEFYQYTCDLINKNMKECEIINNGYDNGSFDDFKVGENNQSYTECFAEFLRADLVDHDGFVTLIGSDNYDKLYDKLETMDRRSEDEYDYSVRVSGPNNHVDVIRHKGNQEENVNISTTKYDKKGRVNEDKWDDGTTIKYEFNDDNQVIKATYINTDGKVSLVSDYEYSESYNADGQKVYTITERSSNGVIYEKTFINGEYDSYVEKYLDSEESLVIKFKDGKEIERKTIKGKGSLSDKV